MKDFRKLQVWEKAHQLTLDVYKLTDEFPHTEQFGLISQMRRSASSIPTNIAEGCGRGSDSDFARFLQIGMGSASELEYQMILSHDLGYLTPANFDQVYVQVVEVKKMLSTFIKTLRR